MSRPSHSNGSNLLFRSLGHSKSKTYDDDDDGLITIIIIIISSRLLFSTLTHNRSRAGSEMSRRLAVTWLIMTRRTVGLCVIWSSRQRRLLRVRRRCLHININGRRRSQLGKSRAGGQMARRGSSSISPTSATSDVYERTVIRLIRLVRRPDQAVPSSPSSVYVQWNQRTT